MANDDIDRKIEFIVNQQAQFSADIIELKELHVKAEARMTNLENVVLRLVDVVETGFSTLTDRMNDMVTAQTLLDTRMAELAESQTHTDQRLNALIDIVREGRNGKGTS
jgi:translation initiation factor 2B subunit (eIF-2B alpha/beta/delta family)